MTPRPFTLHRPAQQAAGLILTSPHSGRCYPQALLDASRLDAKTLRSSEDAFVDELFGLAPALGIPLLLAEFPRAWCDANREPWELDPTMFAEPLPAYVNTTSPRVAAGLGTVPRNVGFGEAIYKHKLPFREAELRVETCWRPFHAALAGLIDECQRDFGHCLVLDCHSMPSPLGRASPRPNLVLGDNYGASCLPIWSQEISASLSALGFSVARNTPYAGGFITRHYARPTKGVQVIQLEISRGLYMNEQSLTLTPDAADIAERLMMFLRGLVLKLQAWEARTNAYSQAAE